MENEEKKIDEVVDTREQLEDTNQEIEQDSEIESQNQNESENVETQGEPQIQEPTFTQSQVNEIVGKARQEARERFAREYLERYGVDDEEQLNEIFGRGQGYNVLSDDYNSLNTKYTDIMSENALLKSNIAPNRYGDVKAILSSKGMEITQDNIMSELATHPEWVNNIKSPLTPDMAENMANTPSPSVISQLGTSVPKSPVADDSESDKAMKMFNI